MCLNTHFHILNNITHIFTFFYPHVYQKHSNNITQILLPNTLNVVKFSEVQSNCIHRMYKVCVWAPRPRFSVHVFYFFFFLARICWLWETIFTVMNTHCAYTVHILKNIKNESHDTIYIFKNYFATVFSVFNNNKFNTNTPKDSKHALAWKDLRSIQFFMLIF